MKYLITASLLDGYDWLKTCPKNWKKSAMDRFCAMIRREERPMTEALKRGIEFEDLVCKNSEKSESEFFEFTKKYWGEKGADGDKKDFATNVTTEVFSACKGGKQQVRMTKDIKIKDKEYHLFGYADIVFPKKIIDIKTTGKYREGYDYVKRSQHYLYSVCSGINTFEYLVTDFKESNYPQELHRVEFDMNQEENLWVLETRIKELMEFLLNNGLYGDYCDIFTAIHDDNKRRGK